MDQQKIGIFLKELRNEKKLTQEQLAEKLGVSRRTVSRWETGSNMPDLDILVEMADYYDVDLRELFDGERRSGKMNKEVEGVTLGIPFAMVSIGAIMTSKYAAKIRAFKKRISRRDI